MGADASLGGSARATANSSRGPRELLESGWTPSPRRGIEGANPTPVPRRKFFAE